jgi:hypothetical protein
MPIVKNTTALIEQPPVPVFLVILVIHFWHVVQNVLKIPIVREPRLVRIKNVLTLVQDFVV